jgi:hypothetical protein
MALAEKEMYKQVEVSDCARSNVAYVTHVCDNPVSQFILTKILQKHGLDGNCAYSYYLNEDRHPVFILDDPPHVLKRVSKATRNHDLQGELNGPGVMVDPMSMSILEDVY